MGQQTSANQTESAAEAMGEVSQKRVPAQPNDEQMKHVEHKAIVAHEAFRDALGAQEFEQLRQFAVDMRRVVEDMDKTGGGVEEADE